MRNSKQKGSVGEVFIILVILAILGLATVGSFVYIPYQTGRGEHTGLVTAVEKSGLFFKTGRAYVKTDGQSSQEDIYCVTDEAVYQQLLEASREKKQVTVSHISVFSTGLKCEGEPAIVISAQVK
jgi:hypothetical protein